ncbi:VanZ family protein [Lachnospiraceae bacterium MD1]|uniref:VanZ family protein n=1 Tax=Variimorphobacter saccharofermentans TaxID=2755051 RepID=A0A839K2C9_9FIRM|nr:VanZ family protein [Variimorphobacter saccharofermentans]MBB2183776.1 VanZ family protein [Variimorphobacter saccharofermentans]
MLEITYWELLIVISIVWVIMRVLIGIKNKKIFFFREAQMMMVYICIIVIARIVNFPWHHVNGQIGTMKFDASRIIPPWVNLVPIVHLFDIYDGWQMNIIGNITMFIPVGIVWPVCFKKLNTIGKAILAGAGFSLFIEISQLLFYERCSDIDDILLNTAGVAVGALIFFGCKKLRARKRE